jgi:hypothetical protein
MLPILAGIICLIFIGYFVKAICFDRKEIVLSVMILNDNEDMDIDTLETELKDYLGTVDSKQDITFSFLRTDIEQNQAIILTRLRARAVDLIIADEPTFSEYVQNGIYKELEIGVQEEDWANWEKGNIINTDESGNIESIGETLVYGYKLGENQLYLRLGGQQGEPVIGIAINTMHGENAKKAIKYFMENEE